MKYDVSDLDVDPSLDLRSLFPDLAKNRVLWETPLGTLENKRTMIIVWIIWMHDINTPLSAYSTIQERRVVVRKKLGIITNPDWYTKMEKYESPEINAMVVSFLKQEYNISYAELKTYETAHTKLLEKILATPDSGTITSIKNLKNEIENCKTHILGQVRAANLEKELEKAVIEENIMLDYNDLIDSYAKGETIHRRYSV